VYQFCVSGAAKGTSVEEGKALAVSAGRAIAEAGHSIMTGATTGLPNYAATGYKEAGGKMSLGLSPASTKVEHVVKYRLPTENYDTILFTGLHYVGRDSLLITSADAVVSIGGRMGTLHEFTIAMETRTPIGFLQGAGGISEEIQKILDILPDLHKELVIFDTDPEELVSKLTKLLNKINKPYKAVYS
jgi:uncharacterized protein (TIGR00725 family)